MKFNLISVNKNRFINSIQSVLSSALINVINIIIIGILINEYGNDEYGKYAFVYVTITLIGSTLGLSIGGVCSTLVASRMKRNIIQVYRLGLLTLFLAVFFGILISIGVSFEIFPTFGLSKSTFVAIMCLSIIMSTADSFLKSILIGLKKINVFFWGVVVAASVNIFFLYFLKNNFGIYIGLISYSLSLVSFIIISLISLKIHSHSITLKMFRKRGESTQLRKDAFINLLSSVFFPSVLWFVYFMLRNYGGNNNVAEFNLAYQCFLVVTFVPATANRILLPYIVESKTEKDRVGLLKQASKINLIISIPIVFILILFGNDLFKLLSSKIVISQFVIVTITFAAALVNLTAPTGIYLMARADFLGGLKLNFLSMLLLFFLSAFLIPKNGVIGACLAFLLSYTFHAVVSYNYLKKSII